MTETPTATQDDTPPTVDPAPPTAPQASNLPPDPVAYDSPRAVRARAKGLQAPYIAGGEDPDPSAGIAQDRRYVRLLLAMAIAIVASGFVIGTVISLVGPAGGR